MYKNPNLDKIVPRSAGLAPVSYVVELPGILAIELNRVAMDRGNTVAQEIIDAVDLHCQVSLVVDVIGEK